MTPEQIHEAALEASVKAIEFAIKWNDSLTGFRHTADDDDAIVEDMRRIAGKVGRGSVCDLSFDPEEAS